MGCYINPTNLTKEAWLHQHATETTHEVVERFNLSSPSTEPSLPLVLIDNGNFKALGVLYSEDERDQFLADRSGRPKRYYIAPVAEIAKVAPLKLYLREEA